MPTGAAASGGQNAKGRSSLARAMVRGRSRSSAARCAGSGSGRPPARAQQAGACAPALHGGLELGRVGPRHQRREGQPGVAPRRREGEVQGAVRQLEAARQLQTAQAPPLDQVDQHRQRLQRGVGAARRDRLHRLADIGDDHARCQREQAVRVVLVGAAADHRQAAAAQVGRVRADRRIGARQQGLLQARIGGGEVERGVAGRVARHRARHVDEAGAQVGLELDGIGVAQRLHHVPLLARQRVQQVEVGAAGQAIRGPHLVGREVGQHTVAQHARRLPGRWPGRGRTDRQQQPADACEPPRDPRHAPCPEDNHRQAQPSPGCS